MIDIGSNIKEYRLKRHMTQQELGDKLFVSDKTISSWESGRTLPDINIISELSNILECSFLSLIFSNKSENIELEVKIKATDKEQLRIIQIIENDSILLKDEDQESFYYESESKKMSNEWLRIRRENNNVFLNYKKKVNNIINEYNVGIDNIENIKTIFELLDFKCVSKINKHRISYIYKNKYEFSFDKVDNLGEYIEIEVKKYDYDYDKEIELLNDLINELNININDIELNRYPELINSK